MDLMTARWPVAEPDDIARFKALASAVRGAHVTEGTLDAPFDEVGSFVDDLETSLGLLEPDMRRLNVLVREGDRVEALAVSRWGMRAVLRGTARPGWCWLQSTFLVIGFAAAPEGLNRTRVAFAGGIRIPGRAALIPLGTKWAGRRALRLLASATASRT